MLNKSKTPCKKEKKKKKKSVWRCWATISCGVMGSVLKGNLLQYWTMTLQIWMGYKASLRWAVTLKNALVGLFYSYATLIKRASSIQSLRAYKSKLDTVWDYCINKQFHCGCLTSNNSLYNGITNVIIFVKKLVRFIMLIIQHEILQYLICLFLLF